MPKRNKKKLASPSKFDNSVAGGVRAGEGVFGALEREAYEEAGLKKEQLNNVKLANYYFNQLIDLTKGINSSRPEIKEANEYILKNSTMLADNV